MSMTAEDFLEHHGVKGQKWGVRRNRTSGSDSSGGPSKADTKQLKKDLKKDKKWMRSPYTMKGAIALHNATAEKMNAALPGFNAKHPKADLLNSPGSRESQRYIKEYQALVDRSYSEAVKQVHGVSPSGRFAAKYDPIKQKVVIDVNEISHADNALALEFEVNINDGKITSMREIQADTLVQDIMELDDVLEHFGVKGQKWGVRRDPSGTHGGAKPNPLRDVSDEDLRKMVNRLQMEQQFRSLSEKTANKTAIDHGAAFMQNVVGPAVKVAIAGAITARIAKVLKSK